MTLTELRELCEKLGQSGYGESEVMKFDTSKVCYESFDNLNVKNALLFAGMLIVEDEESGDYLSDDDFNRKIITIE